MKKKKIKEIMVFADISKTITEVILSWLHKVIDYKMKIQNMCWFVRLYRLFNKL